MNRFVTNRRPDRAGNPTKAIRPIGAIRQPVVYPNPAGENAGAVFVWRILRLVVTP